jgi:hypothetical protein
MALAFRAGYIRATISAAVVLAAASTLAQEPAARNPHAGEWSLEFRVATRPGGESRIASINLTPPDTQTINLLLHVSRPSFGVAADGALRWEQQEGTLFHWDDFSSLVGRTSTADGQTVLRVVGKTIAMLAPPGSGRTYDRRLTLDLTWGGGNTSGFDHLGKPFTVAAGAAVYEQSSWELEPISVQREEIAPDVIRETTIFRATRQKATSTFKFGAPPAPFPVTERIEIKHIHYPRLVPRG